VYDSDATASWTLFFSAYEGAESGRTPFWWNIAQDSTSGAGTPGYTRIDLDLSASPVAVREWTDLDGDMVNTIVSYCLDLTTVGATVPNAARFFGAAVHGRRTITPAPTLDTFGDVSTGHPFLQHIEALVDSASPPAAAAATTVPRTP